MNIPNLITIFRILLTPLLIIFLLEDKPNFALVTFIAAGAGDGLDGFLARVLNQKTTLGAWLDPIADKILISASCITMAILNGFPPWLVVIMVSRDVLIMGGIGVLMLNDYTVEVKPTPASKITTFVQLFTICFFLGHEYTTDYWFLSAHLVNLTAFFTLLSGGQYLLQGFKILEQDSGDD